MRKYQKLNDLLAKYLSGTASPEERAAVEKWYEAVNEDNSSLSPDSPGFREVQENMYRHIRAGLQQEATVVPLYKRTWLRIAAAAIMIFLPITLYLTHTKNNTPSIVADRPLPASKKDIAPPAKSQATLILADGQKITLDSTVKGIVAEQGSSRVIKKEDGQLAYTRTSGTEPGYNTLVVPKGSKPVSVTLEDGTKVWINVASSITYPTAFTGKERKVAINGEAYFEVAKDPAMPFIVQKEKEGVQIEVLGTHFNVNAYDDEPNLKVTLLEGSVNVSKGAFHHLLRPGQQVTLDDKRSKVSDAVDQAEVMAWRDGRFYFSGSNIHTIMRQIEKWYNVDISYSSTIPYSFVAKISRDVNVSELLHILEATDLVHFRIEGNRITVLK